MDFELLNQKCSIVNNDAFLNRFQKRYIAKLNIKPNDKVAIAYWVSPVLFYYLQNKYPNTEFYFIEDNKYNIFGVNSKYYIYCNTNNGEYFPNMKFDKIIMNPPYNKNLHLKILKDSLNHITKNGKIVSIQPIRWLQDPFAFIKRSTLRQFEDLCKYIKSIDVISPEDANKLFNIFIYSGLGIYELDLDIINHKFDYKNFWKEDRTQEEISIINKVCFGSQAKLGSKIEKDKINGVRVLIADIAGGRGNLPVYKDFIYAIDGKKDSKDWTLCKSYGWYGPKTLGAPLPNSILFSTENEAINFYSSINTNFYRFLCAITVQQQHIQLNVLPFMDDYTHEWTDEDFYKFFNITKEEQKIIEDTIKEFEK